MFYFTVGPTQEYPRFREFLADALAKDIHSISHRSPQFVDLFHSTTDSVRSLLRVSADRQVFFAGSATEWMERCVQNMSTERTLHFVSGTFAKRFYDFALAQGRDARKVDQKPDGSFDIADIPAEFVPEMIALTHNETSNGTQLSEDLFVQVRAAYPDALIALDIVSSAPVHPDAFTSADVLFFSVQKGFGMPAGLGVALVSPRAIARSAELAAQKNYTGAFHSFAKLSEYALKGNTVETPNVLAIHILDAIARDLSAGGIGYGLNLAAGATVMGALAVQANEILMGRDPQDMTNPSFWGRAAMKGGAFGVVGDIATTGQASWGGGYASYAAGPVPQLGQDVYNLTFKNAMALAYGEDTNFAGDLAKFGKSYMPMGQTPIIGPALDRLWWDQMQLLLDPDSADALAKAAKNRANLYKSGDFWMPGTVAPQRAPNFANAIGR